MIEPGRTREETFVFLAPADLAVGSLRVGLLGRAPLPSLPKLRTPSALALPGPYAEASRHLKFGFTDPLMERLRMAAAQRVQIVVAGEGFDVTFSPAGVTGTARFVGEGVYSMTLTDGTNRLACHLRLIEGGNRLILHLAGGPFHQIVYDRK